MENNSHEHLHLLASNNPELSRRTLFRHAIGLTAAVATGNILAACGAKEYNSLDPAVPLDQTGINQAASANAHAVRIGNQEQINPPPQTQKTWIDGAFVTKVLLPDSTFAFSYTIDDGPSPYNTDLILRECERLGIFVTFFVVGVNIRAWPEILRRIRDAGHEIGSHSVYHSPYLAAPLAGQMAENRQIIQEESGLWVVANRTPGLTKGGDDIILKTARDLKMYELHTSLNQSDYKSPRINEFAIANELTSQIAPGTFSLNHDGGSLRPTGTGWGTIANVALSKGYTCMRATDMINSGIPLPGNVSYLNGAQLLDGSDSQLTNHELITVNTCNYNPEVELVTRLNDVSLGRAERSRIVEVLADIEQMKLAS